MSLPSLDPVPQREPIIADQVVNPRWARWLNDLANKANQSGIPGPAGPAGASASDAVHVARKGVAFASAVDRMLNDKAGERVSVLDFGAIGDGVADDTAAFQAAINAMITAGGGEIYIPGTANFYSLGQLNFTSSVPLMLTGDGMASKMQRRTAIAAGHGWFDLTGAQNVKYRRLVFDGAVTSPTGMLDSTYAGDPLYSGLTLNSTFWLHDSCAFIEWDDVVIQHTGGYSILCNAVAQDITDLYFNKLALKNNRPHLFGSTGGDLNYGSWSGGVLFHGNGVSTTAMVRRARFIACSAHRCTGNCFWQHVYGFSSLHEEIHMTDMLGVDIGLDFVLFAGVTNCSLVGFTTRRVGYITLNDTNTPGTPKWRNPAWGVAVDHAGFAISTVISGGTMISTNGGAIDCDGMAESVITNCVCRTPTVFDPEYIEDQIGTVGWGGSSTPGGPNFAYGIQSGNTSNNRGGIGIVISANKLTNLSGGAIRMYASRNGHVSANDIDHPADATFPPITLGNVSAALNQRAFANVVSHNRINYDPATAKPCIVEDSSLGAFQAGDKNWIVDNPVIAPINQLAYEFKRDANTSSTTGLTCSSNFASLAAPSFSVLQREGRGLDFTSALKIYNVESAISHQHMQLSFYRAPTVLDPVFNVSLDGLAQTGTITTGNRSISTSFADAVVTGKLYGQSFLALDDTTFLDADANALPGTVALLKWDNGLTKWRQSVSVAAGARVWSDFSGGASSVAGVDMSIQYNLAGAFGADANLSWNYTTQACVIRGKTGAAAYAALAVTDSNTPHTAYIQSDGGFLTSNAAFNAIQAPAGGVLADLGGFTTAVQSALFKSTGTGGAITFKNNNGLFSVTGNGDVSGAGVIAASSGLNSLATNFNAVQAAAGGMFALSFTASKYIQAGQSAGVPAVTFGDAFHPGAIFWDTTAAALKVFNGATWLSPVLNIVGTAAQISAVPSGSTFTLSFPNQIVITGAIGGQAIVVNNGYIDSKEGFATISSSYQAIHAYGNGGSWARSHFSIAYTQVGISAGIPTATSGDALGNGAMYYDSSTFRLRAFIAGAWADVLTSGFAGVSTLNALNGNLNLVGTVNQVNIVSGGTVITLSLPQPIATTSNPTFANITGTGAIQSTAAGAAVAFQAGGGAFQVFGNGNFSGQICSSNTYRIGSTVVCDGSRNFTINSLTGPGGVVLVNTLNQFVSTAGINCGRFAGIACRAFSAFDAAGTLFAGVDLSFTAVGGGIHKVVGGLIVS